MGERMVIFDRRVLRLRQRRAYALGAVTFLIDYVADELVARLRAVNRRFSLAADLGSPTPALRRSLQALAPMPPLIAVGATLEAVASDRSLRLIADEEALPFAAGALDLVVSGLALQSVNDLPGALIQIRRALRPNGLFLAGLLGGQSLTELREALALAEAEIEGGISPRVAPFLELREAGALLQRAGFSLPVADIDRLTVRYGSPLELMHELRRMAATNVLCERRGVLKRRTLARALELYEDRFADADGRVRATFEIIWLCGWAPHESQQQPLRPGSAQARLADALGVPEFSAGERAGSPRSRFTTGHKDER